jgi:ribosomal protein S18 acetylase RimI-like enzyme
MLKEKAKDSFMKQYIAYENGQPAGFIEARHTPWNYYVYEMVVDKAHEHQRTAIAQSLMNRLKADAKADGANQIVIQSQAKNLPVNESLYQSVGFERIPDKARFALDPNK